MAPKIAKGARTSNSSYSENKKLKSQSKNVQSALAYAQQIVDNAKNGRRNPKHEKSFVSDLGKMLHATRVQVNINKNNNKNGMQPAIRSNSVKKKIKNKKSNSGTTLVTFKGGFSSISIGNGKDRSSLFRGKLAEKKLCSSIKQYNEYLETARQEAAKADLLDMESNEITEEGKQYLDEQNAIAKQLILKHLPGKRILELAPSKENCADIVITNKNCINPPEFQSKEQKDRYALSVFTLKRIEGEKLDKPIDQGETEAERNKLYYTLNQPSGSVTDSEKCSNEGSNAVCIVKGKGPEKMKATSILYTRSQLGTLNNKLWELLKKEVYPFMPSS